MASLETVVFPQDPFGYYSGIELYGLLGDCGSGGGENSSFLDGYEFGKLGPLDFDNFLDCRTELDGSSGCVVPPGITQPHLGDQLCLSNNAYPNYSCSSSQVEAEMAPEAAAAGERPKRRRGRSRKNKEDIEIQRMTHIAVERNRRKQMNEYLSVLRSLMPESYVPRGDQASIIGGAINYVKELEQKVHLLGARKQGSPSSDDPPPDPFSDCFSLPQYSSAAATSPQNTTSAVIGEVPAAATAYQNEIADIEVTIVESHASMKIRSKRRPKQLLRLVSGLQALRLTVLHLNVSTVRQVVLYSLSLKVEDECKLTSVDEIASAVYEILVKIQEEASGN